VLSALLQASPARPAGPAELYGKPLRGLSAVRLSDVLASPERYAGKAIRVMGSGAGASASAVTISESSASLRVETDGSFSLPDKLDGAQVIAEGRIRKESGSPTFVAVGVEVKR
ncbi:MAG: hypothetical protein ABIT01_06145, partial [Thermoanaerobaculia bacterium]